MSRTEAFDNARNFAETEKLDEAFAAIAEYTSEEGAEYSLTEMKTVNILVCEKLTSCSFDEKKDACFECLELIEGVKLTKSAEWLELYNDAAYDIFSKLSRHAREEERSEVWNRLKEIYYEMTLTARKIWREKNQPGGLEVYVNYAKLIKSYLDVADEESFKICSNYAKDAKCVGKGTLDDDEFRDAKKAIDVINKSVTDAQHEREMLKDED